MLTLKQTRDLVAASQQDLADAAGLQTHLICRIEQGRVERPAHELVVKVIRGLQKLGIRGIKADQIEEFYVPDDAPEAGAKPSTVSA